MPPLLPIDYDSNNESDYKVEGIYMSTQQRRRVVQPEDMPPMVRNVYHLPLRKQNDYVKENIDRSMTFAQVGNYLNEDALLFFHHKGMKHF